MQASVIPNAKAMLVVENAEAVNLALSGGDVGEATTGGVYIVSADALATSWPDYVVARARTSGGVIVDGGREAAEFLRLAEGRLGDQPAVAGLLAGVLVFLTEPADSEAEHALRAAA